jgi:hypothetical protein
MIKILDVFDEGECEGRRKMHAILAAVTFSWKNCCMNRGMPIYSNGTQIFNLFVQE